MIMSQVKRWDIYDIADELADVPGMIKRGEDPSALVTVLATRLFWAAQRAGEVGPYPEYYQTEGINR